jgi:hypothetical protein
MAKATRKPLGHDPAVISAARERKAWRALMRACEAREKAENAVYGDRRRLPPPASCMFADDDKSAARKEHERRYKRARKAAGLGAADKAEGDARRGYHAAMSALARSQATTLEGAIAKMNWLCDSIPTGETRWDGQMLRGLRADLKRLAAKS